MKKKFIAATLVAVIAAFAGYNIYKSQNTVTMSDLAMANVEALAFDPEWGSTTSPCTPCIPKVCEWVKRIGFQQYLVREVSAEFH